MKSRSRLASALLAAALFWGGTAQGGQWLLMTLGNKFAFADSIINVDAMDLGILSKSVVTGYDGTVYQLVVWIDVQNISDHAETFIPREDLKVVVGGASFSDTATANDPKYLAEIEPATTQERAGVFYIPKAVLKDGFIIRAKNDDIKVSVIKVGKVLPFGVFYRSPEG
jgi:hypothetical protein